MPKILLLYTLITLVILYTEFVLIWTPPWPHERNIFKNRYSLISQNFVWKLNFFPRQAMPKKFFALHFQYIGDTPYRVWIDLNNSLTTWKRTIFKVRYSLNLQNYVWKPNFFPRLAMPTILFPHTLITLVMLHTEFGLIWTTWQHEKKTIFIVRYSLNSQNSVWKPNFFPRQAMPTILFPHTLITLVMLHTEFGLIWTFPWQHEKELFLKFVMR